MIKSHKRAFTIIEISVVLLIVGLIVAAISMLSSVFIQSTLQRVIASYNDYESKIQLFYEQFQEYPGDITTAFSIWDTTCAPTANECNGDGNGFIDWAPTNNTGNESWRAWQHLSLAKIDQNYLKGVGVSNASVVSDNIPASNYIPLGWEFRTYQKNDENLNFYTTLDLYDPKSSIGVTAFEASWIDNKIDDGAPRRGRVILKSSSPSNDCYISSSTPYQYKTDDSLTQCILQFVIMQQSSSQNYE